MSSKSYIRLQTATLFLGKEVKETQSRVVQDMTISHAWVESQ